jgi:exonuclease SbcD
MIEKVREAVTGCINKLDPNLPAILLGHGTIETAQFGGEQDLSIGKVLSYPLSYFQKKELDYVGFGHIHRHQVIQEKPLILYAGSLERVDFGEENEDKGFVYLEVEKGKPTHFEFISTNPREFITIQCDLTKSENPQEELEEKIINKKKPGIIIRIRYKINEGDLGKINHSKIKTLLDDSFAFVIQPEIVKKERTYRISDLDSSLISSPLTALEKYLFDYSEEEKKKILEKARELQE